MHAASRRSAATLVSPVEPRDMDLLTCYLKFEEDVFASGEAVSICSGRGRVVVRDVVGLVYTGFRVGVAVCRDQTRRRLSKGVCEMQQNCEVVVQG